MAEQVTIDLSEGDAYAMATWSAFDQIDPAQRYRIKLGQLRQQLLASAYVAEYLAITALGTPYPQVSAHMTEGIGGLGPRVRTSPVLRPWVRDLYLAQIRSCRWFASSSGLDVPHPALPEWSAAKTQMGPAIVRAAAVSPVLVTAGVVAAVAAVSLAIAWWARGRDQAAASGAAIKQAAAAAAAAKIATSYVQQGKDPPPEVIGVISQLARGETDRAWGVPLAAVGAAGVALGVAGAQAWQART